MPEAILWIYDHQRWIYLILVALCAWQVFLLWRAQSRLRFTAFSIERENLIRERNRGLTMIFLFAALMAAVLLSNAFLAPNLADLFGFPSTPTPILPTDTPGPTVTAELVLPGLESATPDLQIGPTATRTPVPAGGSGCMFPGATITSPIPGAILADVVEVRGTANIDNFAFYVVEVSTLGENWLTVITAPRVKDAAGIEHIFPVVDDVLGTWDTRLQDAGDYALRLVVYDAVGNHPVPCTIPITIVALVEPTDASLP